MERERERKREGEKERGRERKRELFSGEERKKNGIKCIKRLVTGVYV